MDGDDVGIADPNKQGLSGLQGGPVLPYGLCLIHFSWSGVPNRII